MVGESWQYKTSATFLVTNIPYMVILGAAWRWEEMATWDLRRKSLTVGAGERKNTVNLEGCQTAPAKGPKDLDCPIWNKEDKVHADATSNYIEEDIQRIGTARGESLGAADTQALQGLQDQAQKGTDPADETPDSAAVKDAICIVLQEATIKKDLLGENKNKNKGSGMCEGTLALGPTPNRINTKLETWLGGDGVRCPANIKKVQCSCKHLFCYKLATGLPPPRVIDHTITFLPGQMTRKGAVYRVVGEELEAPAQNPPGAKGEQMDRFAFVSFCCPFHDGRTMLRGKSSFAWW
ncbi:hypothetical protein Efla_004406 [Eimeria flavescens]